MTEQERADILEDFDLTDCALLVAHNELLRLAKFAPTAEQRNPDQQLRSLRETVQAERRGVEIMIDSWQDHDSDTTAPDFDWLIGQCDNLLEDITDLLG